MMWWSNDEMSMKDRAFITEWSEGLGDFGVDRGPDVRYAWGDKRTKKTEAWSSEGRDKVSAGRRLQKLKTESFNAVKTAAIRWKGDVNQSELPLLSSHVLFEVLQECAATHRDRNVCIKANRKHIWKACWQYTKG